MLFDTAINTALQRVSTLLSDFGYMYSDSEVVKIILGCADGICNMTSLASHNQAVANVIQEWLEWSQTMRAKPKKCKTTAMIGGKPVDPKLMIGGSLMGYIDKATFKFLGKQITVIVSDKAT